MISELVHMNVFYRKLKVEKLDGLAMCQDMPHWIILILSLT